jgi:predicted membrane protein
VDELILFVCVLFFVYIYFKQDEMPVEESKSLGWVIIFIMLFSILKNLFVLLYFGFLNMRKKMKSMFSAEDEALDSPHTSDGNSDTIDSIPTEEIEDEVRREVYEKQEYNERIKQRQDERGIKNKDGSQFNNNMQQQQYNP